jgi:hypothetical protein
LIKATPMSRAVTSLAFSLATISLAAIFGSGQLLAQLPVAEFKDAKGRYSFTYPNYFKLDREFADGTGDVVGVRSEPGGGQEASISVRIETPRLTSPSVAAYTDQVKQDFAAMPRAKVVLTETRKLLGQDASDVQLVRDKMRFRIIGLVSKGQDVYVRCVYTNEVAEMFGPACEMVAETLKLKP